MLLKDKTDFIHVSGEGLEELIVLSVIDQIQDSLNKSCTGRHHCGYKSLSSKALFGIDGNETLN